MFMASSAQDKLVSHFVDRAGGLHVHFFQRRLPRGNFPAVVRDHCRLRQFTSRHPAPKEACILSKTATRSADCGFWRLMLANARGNHSRCGSWQVTTTAISFIV